MLVTARSSTTSLHLRQMMLSFTSCFHNLPSQELTATSHCPIEGDSPTVDGKEDINTSDLVCISYVPVGIATAQEINELVYSKVPAYLELDCIEANEVQIAQPLLTKIYRKIRIIEEFCNKLSHLARIIVKATSYIKMHSKFCGISSLVSAVFNSFVNGKRAEVSFLKNSLLNGSLVEASFPFNTSVGLATEVLFCKQVFEMESFKAFSQCFHQNLTMSFCDFFKSHPFKIYHDKQIKVNCTLLPQTSGCRIKTLNERRYLVSAITDETFVATKRLTNETLENESCKVSTKQIGMKNNTSNSNDSYLSIILIGNNIQSIDIDCMLHDKVYYI